MKNIIRSIKSFKFVFLLFFIVPNLSKASPTDCRQTSSDGQINCTQPAQYWVGDLNDKATYWSQALTIAFNHLVSAHPDGTITLKTTSSPPTPLPCTSGADLCSQVTGVASNNAGGRVAIWFLSDFDPSHYVVYAENFYNNYTCPITESFIQPDSSIYYGVCKPPTQTRDLGCATCQKNNGVFSVGKPINIGSGNQYETETDYVYGSANPIAFTRYYNSQMMKWSHTYQRALAYTNTTYGEFVALSRPNQDSIAFKKISGNWVPASPDMLGSLSSTGSGDTLVWTYINPQNEKETYNSSGILTSITQSTGNVLTMNYDMTGSNGQLIGVSDSQGNTLSMTTSMTISGCSGLPLITSIAGGTYNYSYDSLCNVKKVTYPDLTYKTYTYDGNELLVSMADENFDDYMQWSYGYVSGRGYLGMSTSLGSSHLIDKYTIGYTTPTTLTDSLGNSNSFNTTKTNNVSKNAGSSQACVKNCQGLNASSVTYDTNGNPTTVVDFNSNTTKITYTPLYEQDN